ncbi:sensor domain-containing diguanylate cyclase [Vibrio sinaloensis]|uniref:sensor domain-containing diguanylate cyclase n=1 Tax=Photobacterium sp. (strain ATCC 43367) TaxID=379097 RepID=UPI00057D23A7|nr:sensor domain-containing diguanylate cyclase [Vibrio sinaloensis]KHT40866.1 diguanylate cyclase [Vibrio sinaloensis]
MKEPAKPDNEEQRIADLQGLNILDTEPEERFDRVTRLAKRLLDVPIAVVSLVDSNRQWFKSCLGLDATETPRSISFCGHAILGDEPFIIPDAKQDTRFMGNPLVENEPHIRFYAGIPLVYHDNSKLGTLCVIDTKPRELQPHEVQDLVDLAKIAEQELANSLEATLDSLTKVSNRRGFNVLAHKSIEYCRFGGLAVSVAYFDLNDFKLINDNYGHQVGDEVLKNFAGLLRASFRDSDVLARMGGDEFIVLMSGASEIVANVAVERFRRCVAQYNETAEQEQKIQFSVGLAAAKVTCDFSLNNLVELADQRMYDAKKAQANKR